MGTYVLVKTDGTIEKHEGGKKLDLKRIYGLIGCGCVDRVKVRYEGRLRDARTRRFRHVAPA